MPKSELDLPAIKAQAEAATPKPWLAVPSTSMKWDERGDVGIVADVQKSARVIAEVFELVDYDVHAGAKATAEFIAACRTNVPALVEALEEAEPEIGRTWVRGLQAWDHAQRVRQEGQERLEEARAELREYQQSEASLGDAYVTCVAECEEAREKLRAIKEAHMQHKWRELGRILEGK